MTNNKVQRFLLLPPRGLRASASPQSMHLGPMLAGLMPQQPMPKDLGKLGMTVLDSVHENGIKLVEMDAAAARVLHLRSPGMRIVPEVFFRSARAPMLSLLNKKPALATATAVELQIESRDGHPVAGATVVAFTDFAAGLGGQGKTRTNGRVRLRLEGALRIQRLYIYPEHTAWPVLLRNIALPRDKPIQVPLIDLDAVAILQHFAALAPSGDGAGVKVGIIDTGVGPHHDVPVLGGENTVTGEAPGDHLDNGSGHGTHVAGIVGARVAGGQGMVGLAPAAALHAYRVFGQGSALASNFSIAKAIDRAVADGCDLINMSLGGGDADPATSAAIADARAAGVVVICAAGNDGADTVSEPGADSRAVAVGAFGRKGLMPSKSISAQTVGQLGSDPLNFMAKFSNRGSAIDFAGPGVGVVSTFPQNRWAVMDGTSMACPAVTGAAARILGRSTTVLAMPRGQARSDEILKLVFASARPMGFGPEYEGFGWPRK